MACSDFRRETGSAIKILLSYEPRESLPNRAARGPILLCDRGHNPCADRAATLADREAEARVHGDRSWISSTGHARTVSPGMTISVPAGSVTDAGDVGGAEVELRAVVREEERRCDGRPPPSTGRTLRALELGVRRDQSRASPTNTGRARRHHGSAPRSSSTDSSRRPAPLVEQLAAERLDAR